MSKFSGIMAARREPEIDSNTTAQDYAVDEMPETKRRGRPTAKRSDPLFVQTSPYIRKATLQSVKLALLQEGQGREYSELVEELLSDWLKSRKPE